ncbi:MAG: TIGR03862 family flavoprotein [Pseudomonadota bacterium]
MKTKNIVIIGAGPSGLMAAEIIATAGHQVAIYDRMPSFGRKFLMAGRGGLNLTHSEPLEKFITRYGQAENWLAPHIKAYPAEALRAWCEGLGQETFIGSSGRIFPRAMKASPLLRAWLQRLERLGVNYHTSHSWQGFDGENLIFINSEKQIVKIKSDATLLALGGASWSNLGSDGSWVEILKKYDVEISPLRPANCGFIAPWSDYFANRFAGTPLKSVAITHQEIFHLGEIMITKQGIEGGAVYALSASLREAIEIEGKAVLYLDLRPAISISELTKKLQMRSKTSLSNYLRKIGFSALAIALLYEIISSENLAKSPPDILAKYLKALPITLTSTTNIERAISTAGGICQKSVDENFMLKNKLGVFVAGEMLDWEAPTGGYLLQGCFSTAFAAAKGLLDLIDN